MLVKKRATVARTSQSFQKGTVVVCMEKCLICVSYAGCMQAGSGPCEALLVLRFEYTRLHAQCVSVSPGPLLAAWGRRAQVVVVVVVMLAETKLDMTFFGKQFF